MLFWHTQHDTHAAWAIPSAIVLQVGRFHYDRQHDRAIKRRYGVVPSPVLEFPVFEQGMQCRNEVLQLNSAVIHLGEAPTHGHYRTLLYDAGQSQFWLTDDNSVAIPVDAFDVGKFHSDVYILIYQRCQ